MLRTSGFCRSSVLPPALFYNFMPDPSLACLRSSATTPFSLPTFGEARGDIEAVGSRRWQTEGLQMRFDWVGSAWHYTTQFEKEEWCHMKCIHRIASPHSG